jgi:hypothetical protein
MEDAPRIAADGGAGYAYAKEKNCTAKHTAKGWWLCHPIALSISMNPFSVYRQDIGLPGELPQFHVAFIVNEHGRTADGKIRLGADCATYEEVDYWADKLIRSINEARDAAKGILGENGC